MYDKHIKQRIKQKQKVPNEKPQLKNKQTKSWHFMCFKLTDLKYKNKNLTGQNKKHKARYAGLCHSSGIMGSRIRRIVSSSPAWVHLKKHELKPSN